MDSNLIVILIVIIFMAFSLVIYVLRYKKVPKDHAMVVYRTRASGKGDSGFMVMTGGAKFIKPVVEDYKLLPLYSFDIDMSLDNVMTIDKKRRLILKVKTRVGIGRHPKYLNVAVEHFLDKPEAEIKEIASLITEGVIREVCLKHTYDEMDYETDKIVNEIFSEAERRMNEIRLDLSGLRTEDVQIDKHRDRYVLET